MKHTEQTKDAEIKSHEAESKLKLKRIVSSACVESPIFDGKISWINYLKQLETATKSNDWSDREKADETQYSLDSERDEWIWTT